MTNLIRRFLNFLALLLLLFLGIEFLLWAALLHMGGRGETLRSFILSFNSLSMLGQFAFAILLILLPLFVFSLAVRVRRKQVIIRAKSKEGDEINLTEEAVRKCLHHQIRAIPEVAGIKSRSRNGKGGPRVLLRLWVWAGSNVPEIRRRVREEAARSLRQLFGLGEIEKISVIVEGLVFRKGRGKRVSRRPTGAEEAGNE